MFKLIASPSNTFDIVSAYTGEVLYTTKIKEWAEDMICKMGLKYHIKEICENNTTVTIYVWDPENDPMFN